MTRPLLAEPGLRQALATALNREESLSLGQAVRFARLPIAAVHVVVKRSRAVAMVDPCPLSRKLVS